MLLPVYAGQGVEIFHVPSGGLQPQVASGPDGGLHVVYFQGEADAGDVYYIHRPAGQIAFSDPIQVNSTPGSVVAIGTVRGAHMALGRSGRVHVAWMSADSEDPGMMYARLDERREGFEPQRNVVRVQTHLNGGGSIAADDSGRVYVAWHAGDKGEETRRVWLARSVDDGQSFAAEERSNRIETGACGCCGMRAGVDGDGNVFLMYRAATSGVHRDLTLLRSRDAGRTFQALAVHPWELAACPMTTTHFTASANGPYIAWETAGQVYWSRISGESTPQISTPVAPPGEAGQRKHPSIAVNAEGETLLAWIEGSGWKRGGSLAWQIFDANGLPSGASGRIADAIPVWSTAGVAVREDGGFVVVY